jgi:RNA polymerase sigma-70 factor (ECF subfamily)
MDLDEQRELDAARGGDEDAFGRLVEPRRAELHAHCYRMLGSLHDADDAVQDTLMRAWQGLAGFERGRPFSPWLYRIATNACLDAIGKRPKRMLPIDEGPPARPRNHLGEPLPESVSIEPYPDQLVGLRSGYATPEASYEQRESVELAFIALLQHLAPRQRAVLILREVLGFSAREVAESLDTTTASVNSALQRARRVVEERRPARSQQATMRGLGDARVREIVDRLTDAFEGGDVDAILAMLSDDATFSMPPYRGWCRGRAAVGDSWLMPDGPPQRLRYVPTTSNGQIALGTYELNADVGRYLPVALDVLTLRGALISDITAFRAPLRFPRFGLPAELPGT